jgi:acetyl-CoA acyltransferase
MEARNGAYIVSSVRTAVGKADRGSLRNFRPEDMGAVAVTEAVRRVKGLKPEQVEDVLMGCAFPEGPQGMNVGRVIAQKSGLPDETPGATVNRFCSSGLQTIAMAAQAVIAGHMDVVVAGGTESMSMVPMSGFFFQPDPDIVHGDPNVYVSMGITSENVAAKYNISRKDQDRFALRSHQRALEAIQNGFHQQEIVPLHVQETLYVDGEVKKVEKEFAIDEGPRPDTSMEALSKLPPVFRAGGTVTAGNSSQRSDGAGAAVIVSERIMRELNVEPMARLIGYALGGVPPELMGIGPIPAVRKVLKQTGLSVEDIGLVELNEAFAAQSLAVIRDLGFDEEKVNVNGGAIALGHPLGATGAKLTANLLYEMKRRSIRYGIVTMCVGGGMGAAGVFENLML